VGLEVAVKVDAPVHAASMPVVPPESAVVVMQVPETEKHPAVRLSPCEKVLVAELPVRLR
jgi:hypothetical protein